MTPILKRITLTALIFYSVVLVLLLSLGFWQLDRARQKRVYITQQQQRQAEGELIMDAGLPDDAALFKYRPIKVSGQYDAEHQFLIDNQHVNGKVGYFVLTPLRIAGTDKAVLVNRGWIPLNKDRSQLPKLLLGTENITLKGRVNAFPGVGFKLAGAEIPTATWPSVVQVVDTRELAKTLGYPLFSFQIELDPMMPAGFLRVWHTVTPMPPETHIAYAVQWFGLALTFTLLFFWLHFKKTS